MGQSSAPWWRTFFDDAYVDAWAADGAFESTDEVAAQLIDFLDLPSRARVLDIPCGFGRFSQPLHDAGYDVVGVDGSDDQIRLAQQRHPGPTYLVGDMREPPSGPFDAVLNLYSSFGYFDDPADDIRCLSAWYEVLRPGGMLVLETMHRDRLAWLWGQDHDPGTRRETDTTDWTTGVRTASVQIDGQTRTFTVRLYTATDLIRMMREIRFIDIEAFGGLDSSQLDPSKRLAIRARRP